MNWRAMIEREEQQERERRGSSERHRYEMGWSNWDDVNRQADIALMQLTGLKDKNGSEIYEGDIVKLFTFKRVYSVKWIPEIAQFRFMAQNSRSTNWNMHKNAQVEIIGNIHCNAELLSDPKKES
jgi:uncharacterized phage protein (TIGR01671 family)